MVNRVYDSHTMFDGQHVCSDAYCCTHLEFDFRKRCAQWFWPGFKRWQFLADVAHRKQQHTLNPNFNQLATV